MATPITSASAGLDLPPDLQSELRAFEAAGRDVSLYELLGVAPDSDAATIRRSYLERSRRYHPDAWYRKNVGEFGPLLSRAFQKLSAAYQVLSDEDARAQYDQKLKLRLSQREREALERRALSREEEERRQRERRERLLRTKGFARLGAAHKLYEEAMELALNGERAQAIAALKAARELDPRRAEIGQKLVELEREAARSRSQLAIRSAREHEEKGEIEPALKIYAQALQMDGTNATAAAAAARCAVALGDVRQASTFAARAVELTPDDVDMRMLLARAFLELGFKAKAKAELTRVLQVKKDHEEARALLKRV
ncbi:MAG TPA: J domain-containing protein [Myxococcales bacterium]|jgi:curved DNA-binding protein CbpA|nr:J domain-containing protein [Myxococcales bacterium]